MYSLTTGYTPLFIAVTNDNGEILGTILALIQKEKYAGMFSARSIIWGGPLIKGSNIEILDSILKEYNKQVKGNAIYSQFRNLWEWSKEEKEVFERNGYGYEAHLDIHNYLNQPAPELLMSMHQGRRKNIRRAERIPLEFGEINTRSDFEICISLIEQTYKKVKLPCPDNSFFINAENILKLNGSFKKFAAKYKNEIIACRFVLCYNKLIYDWYAGANDAHLDKYPNDFLPWKIMEWGIIHGYDIFDFGGAGKPNVQYGVRDFKLKFGGTVVNFGRFEKIHNYPLFLIGKTGLNFYKIIKRV